MNARPACRAAQRLLRPRVSYARQSPFKSYQCRRSFRDTIPKRSAHASRPPPRNNAIALVAGAGLLSLAIIGLTRAPRASLDALPPLTRHGGDRDPELPRYRISDVRKHDASSENPWVIHRDKVYDITDWVPAHPGGQVILRAAGGSIDPYWDIFSIHKTDYVYDILSNYLIGYVDSADLIDGMPAQEQIEDPFADDPERDPSLITRTAKPRNAETPGAAMDATFLTPNEVFYVRNHMWVPKVDAGTADTHLLTVELLDGGSKQYTLQDLKTKFPRRTVTAAMQCSGNRRKDMSDGSGRSTNGLQWSTGAMSNAQWEGVSLADVLEDAGLELKDAMSGAGEEKHVHFAGLEAYAASIPIKKAIDPQGDVLLAYAMNGAPLPPDHGFPLRAVVPGHVAARSVKWLTGVTLSDEESSSQWQRRDYKCFGPNETQVDWDAAPAIQELPVQSAISAVKLGAWAGAVHGRKQADGPARLVSLGGYAYSGGGRAIIRVDVSLDGGRSWAQARLTPDCVAPDGAPSPCPGHAAWAWQRWRFDGAIPLTAFREAGDAEGIKEERDKRNDGGQKGHRGSGSRRCTTLAVKATDEAYNTQPESHAATWNLRGNLATAWHRVKVCADCSPGAVATPPSEDEDAAAASLRGEK